MQISLGNLFGYWCFKSQQVISSFTQQETSWITAKKCHLTTKFHCIKKGNPLVESDVQIAER